MCMVNTNNASHFEDCLRVFNVFLFHFYIYFLGVVVNYLDVYICYICCCCIGYLHFGGTVVNTINGSWFTTYYLQCYQFSVI